jgi:hypothetical protein
MRSTEPIEVPPYLCTMSAIVVLNWRENRASRALARERLRLALDLLQGMSKPTNSGRCRTPVARSHECYTRRTDASMRAKSSLLNGDAAQKRAWAKRVTVPDRG